jgi:TolB-like protein
LAALALAAAAGISVSLNVGRWRDRLLGKAASRNEAAVLPAAQVKVRRAVAVLGFKNLSGRSDEAWLSTALSEMLTTELAAGEKLRTIPGENVARMKIDLSLTDADSYAPDTLARIRKHLGSDYVVLGSYLALGKNPMRCCALTCAFRMLRRVKHWPQFRKREQRPNWMIS